MPLQWVGLAALYGDALARGEWDADPDIAAQIEAGRRVAGTEIAQALFTRDALYRAFDAFFAQHELLISPTTPCTAWPLDRLGPATVGGQPVGPRGARRFHAARQPLFPAGLLGALRPRPRGPADRAAGDRPAFRRRARPRAGRRSSSSNACTTFRARSARSAATPRLKETTTMTTLSTAGAPLAQPASGATAPKPSMKRVAGASLGRHDARVLRPLHLRLGRRAGVPEAVLLDGEPDYRAVAVAGELRRRVRRTAVRRSAVRPLRRQARPQVGARRHADADGPVDVHDRPAAERRQRRPARADAARRAAHPAGPGARR